MPKIINFTDVNPISKKENISILKEIDSTIKRKDFILGNAVKKFERQFSKLAKIKYSVGCASGTDALIIALMALNLKKNDQVIVPGMSYISTALSVILNNNQLVFADIDVNTGLISIDNVIQKINNKTKAVIPVNLYGQKVDLKRLRKAIGKRIYIIEDSAQSHFAYSCLCVKPHNKCCNNNRNEKYADISCYSFYPAKNLGAYGDAGLVSTNNKKFYKKLLTIRNLGSIKKHIHEIIGKNTRLDTIQSIVLMKKLKSILKFNINRRTISNYYDLNLKDIKNIKLTKTMPGSSRHLYVIRTKKRDKLKKYLFKKKIFTQIHYPYSLNKLKPLKKIIKKQSLSNSENWAKECLSLPLHPNLRISYAARVINEIKNFFRYK